MMKLQVATYIQIITQEIEILKRPRATRRDVNRYM